MKSKLGLGSSTATRVGAAIVATIMLSGAALAAPLDITGIDGGWANPVGGLNVSISNNASPGSDIITWGDGAAPDSGYVFTPGADIIGVPLNTTIFLGMFTHNNEPIPAGSAITGVDYNLNFSTNGVPAALATTLTFSHNETPNGDNPCANGEPNGVGVNANGCADIVTVTSASLNSQIVVGGDTYFFNLLGFSLDGGNTFSEQFLSAEGSSNRAGLYGIVGTRIPEPSVLAIFGFGLAGLGFAARRRKAA